jgi:hypothetical protein
MSIRQKLSILVLLTLCAGSAIWLLCKPDLPVWRLRAVFYIGSAVDRALLAESSSDALKTPKIPLSGIEKPSAVVALISSPGFRQKIVETAEFEASTAARSKRLVFDTLRANALNNFDITVEFLAASSADARATFRTIVELIRNRHTPLFEQEAQLLQTRIDDYRERSTQLQKWLGAMEQAGDQGPPVPATSQTELVDRWVETGKQLQQLEVAKASLVPTTFPSDAEVYVNGPLTTDSVRLSALAGLAVLVSVLLLSLALDAQTTTHRTTEA